MWVGVESWLGGVVGRIGGGTTGEDGELSRKRDKER